MQQDGFGDSVGFILAIKQKIFNLKTEFLSVIVLLIQN